MKTQMLEIIERHNAVVAKIKEHGELQIDVKQMFIFMEINHLFCCEALDITHMARDLGINAKCNMQSGEIIVYGDIEGE